MDILLEKLGLADLAPEERVRADEAWPLHGAIRSLKALAVWQDLEKAHPGNLAIHLCILPIAYYEISFPFAEKPHLE